MDKRERLIEKIRQRAEEKGFDPDVAVRVAEIESSLRPGVKSRKSSAQGIYQLTEARRRELGIPAKKSYSEDEQIDHGIESLIQTRDYLQNRLDRDPRPHEIYIGHFSGPFGGYKVLSASEDTPLENVLSRKAVQSNPMLKGQTTGQMRQRWEEKFKGLGPRPAAPETAPVPQEYMPQEGPDWEAIGRSQLTAQAPVAPEAMMAKGGEAKTEEASGGEDPEALGEEINKLVETASTDEDFRKLNEMITQLPPLQPKEDVQFFRSANKQRMPGGTGESAMVGVSGHGGMLGAAINKMTQGEKEVLAKQLLASYNAQLGDVGLNANVVRPLEAPAGMYMGSVGASYPVGDGRVFANVGGMRAPNQDVRSTSQSIGYTGKVGPGELNAVMSRGVGVPNSRNLQLQYRVPFSNGGEASSDELTPEEIERASKPAFVTPKSGKGRKEGKISEALRSGEAYAELAKGATMLPQNFVGAGVDLATMAMRPFGYRVEKPVMGSDWLKEKSREAGVAYPEPTDPTLKGFYQMGDVLSNVVNPAGATRAAARGAERTGKAAQMLAQDFQQYNRQLAAPGASYAVRPSGGGVSAMPETGAMESRLGSGAGAPISNMEDWVTTGLRGATYAPGSTPETRAAMNDFWKTKATNYITRQFGTPEDPVFKQIMSGNLSSPVLEKTFRKYMLEQATVGKTKTNPETGETRFYPKYPEAIEDLTRRYDELTGATPLVYSERPGLVEPGRTWMGREGEALARQKQSDLVDRIIASGVRPELVNVPDVNLVTPGPEGKLVRSGYSGGDPEKILRGAQFEGPMLAGRQPTSGAIRQALATEEPIYDVKPSGPLGSILNPNDINEYLATLTPKEIGKIRFEDVVRDSAKFHLKKFEWETLVSDIKAGRRVNEKFFTQGVSAPLLQLEEGPLAGYAWKRLEDSKATVPEGAYVGHSVGGYELGGPTYTKEKRERFKNGEIQVFSLRDNRNRPVTTVEVEMGDKGPVVMQIKGKGRATGNTDPGPYEDAVLQFLAETLKPRRITEHNAYLTPKLVDYKDMLDQAAKNK